MPVYNGGCRIHINVIPIFHRVCIYFQCGLSVIKQKFKKSKMGFELHNIFDTLLLIIYKTKIVNYNLAKS